MTLFYARGQRPIPEAALRNVCADLEAKFPACFSLLHPRPLKPNIHVDLEKAGYVHPDLMDGLSFYTQNMLYIAAIQAGAEKFDLHGKLAGKVTLDEARQANEHRAAIRERVVAKRAMQARIVSNAREEAAAIAVNGSSMPVYQLPIPKAPPEAEAALTQIETKLAKVRRIWSENPEDGRELAVVLLRGVRKLVDASILSLEEKT